MFFPHLSMTEFSMELQYTDIGTRNKTNNAKANQEDIFPQAPIETSIAGIFMVDRQFDNGWHNHTQSTQAHSTDERNEWTQVGQSNGNSTAKYLKKKEISVVYL